MTIRLFFFGILIYIFYAAPGQHYGHATQMGPIYQPTDPATAPHRAEPMYDTDAR